MSSYRSDVVQLDVILERVNREVTTCKVIQIEEDGSHLVSSGVAKLHPKDKPKTDIGEKLALARALKNLANALERQANGLVRHYEKMPEQKAKQAARKAAKEAAEKAKESAAKGAKVAEPVKKEKTDE